MPLAAFLGYLLTTPEAFSSLAVVGVVFGVLLLPVVLKWHHPLLILTWNGAMNAFFLPGRPSFWMLVAGLSFGVTFLSCILNKEQKFQHVPAVTWSLIFLLAVVVVTSQVTGGVGIRALGGSQYGGKRYVFILAAIIGYFALSSVRIRPERVQLFAVLFVLSGITYVVSNLAYIGGPSFWFLFYAFPVELALSHVAADFSVGAAIKRFAGLGFAAVAICNVLILRYGIRGILDLGHIRRLLVFIVAVGVSLSGGFRSTLLTISLLFVIQFCLERLYRTRLLLVLIMCATVGFAVTVPFVSKFPLSIQRTLSIVPFLKVDPLASLEAQGSVEWRVQMWQMLLPQVREYFWIGKGFGIDPTDLYLAEESIRRNLVEGYYGAIVAGDYHSGPLSVIIPLGIFGALAFLCILISGGKLLYRNWKFGDPSHRNVNVFLFSLFLAKTIFYVLFFGSFYNDLAAFLGIIGFSVAVNGVAPQTADEPKLAATPALVPATA